MRLSAFGTRPATSVVLLISILSLATPSLAQRPGNSGNTLDSSVEVSSATTTASNAKSDTASSNGIENPTTATAAPSTQTSATADEASATASTGDPTSAPVVITNSAQPTDAGAAGTTSYPSLTGFIPIPTYPAASVPPTQNAPYMKQSNLPDGTVFIAVGAILGVFGLGILLWRIIVSALLHKSVKRAAMEQTGANAKTGFPAPPAPFYKYTDHASTLSIGGSGIGIGRGARRTTRGQIPSTNLSQSNLFFSPTAAANNQPGNRNSNFLPAGFYAAGSSTPGGQQPAESIGLSNLRPESRGHYASASRNTLNHTPPDSPYFHGRRDHSTSTLNLHQPPGQQRAPSAYLEDLLADDPSAFPPPHMPSQSGGYGSGRNSPATRR